MGEGTCKRYEYDANQRRRGSPAEIYARFTVGH